MTTVSNPNSKPPKAPVNVAFINLEFGRILYHFLSEPLIVHLKMRTVNSDRTRRVGTQTMVSALLPHVVRRSEDIGRNWKTE
jgi:hypothetical protein